MSPSTKSLLRNVSATLAGVGLIVGGWLGAANIVAQDPLAGFRREAGQEDRGVRLTNFDFVAYKDGRLVARAKLGSVWITADRSRIDMTDATQGEFRTTGDRRFGFTAAAGAYGTFTKQLEASLGARITGEGVDIVAPAFTYDEANGTIRVPGTTKGRMFDGQVEATDLVYDARTDNWRAASARWVGTPDLAQEGQPPARRRWDFNAPGGFEQDGDQITYRQVTATDGEVIVKADQVVWNRRTDVVTATGSVEHFGTDANVRAPQAVIDRRVRKATFTGGVNVLVKAEGERRLEVVEIPPLTPFVPDQIAAGQPAAPPADPARTRQEDALRTGENVRDYPATIIADRVEYTYARGARRAVFSGDPQARQELGDGAWRMIWADRGDWNGETDWLRLDSRDGQFDVRMLNSLGDDVRAVWLEVSTKRGENRMKMGPMRGSFTADDEDAPPGGGTTPPPPPALSGPIGPRP